MLLTAALALGVGCRDTGGDGNNNVNHNINNNNPTDNTIYQVQDPAHALHLQPGDLVTLEEVVITAVDTFGDRTGNVWVQEPAGGAYSGVQIFAPTVVSGTTADLNVGDLVTVRGEIDEFALDTDTSGRTVTEIVNGSIEILGVGTPIAPEVVSAQEVMQDPNAEMWEGVLVSVVNVRATDKNEQYGEATFLGGLVAADDLFDVYAHVVVDTCYGQVTGVSNYFFDYFVLPRGAADVAVAANDGDCGQVTAEICDDNVDNDGDGFADCDDWDCENDPACRETDCGDNVDNDGDGDTDCDDSDCLGTVECPAPAENTDALCDDGADNDNDGLVDCEDPSCSGHPAVTVCVETNCTDTIDNDGDGHVDCDDWDCDADPACLETNCNDNVDNDNDGYTDCDDRDCWGDAACDAEQEAGQTECTDGVDNDNDGHTDCDDWSCQDTYAGCLETNCADGIDNDNDGYADCDDFDCQFNDPSCGAQHEADPVSCSDGLDNDGDNFVDCESFSCRCCPSEGCGGFEHVVSTCLPCAP